MNGLSKKQKIVLCTIIECIDRQGYPPTVRELSDQLRIASCSTIFGHLEKLERKGYIKREKNKPRAMKVIKKVV